jgi:hypothetical protein
LLDIDTALLADALHVPVKFPEDEPARAHGHYFRSRKPSTALVLLTSQRTTASWDRWKQRRS